MQAEHFGISKLRTRKSGEWGGRCGSVLKNFGILKRLRRPAPYEIVQHHSKMDRHHWLQILSSCKARYTGPGRLSRHFESLAV